MLTTLRIRWNQFLEEAREKSPREAVRKALSTYLQLNRIVVPVYKDLAALKQPMNTGDTSGLEFLVVDRENQDSVVGMNKTKSRRLKGAANTGSGYHAYAVVSNGEIIGDIWCATPGSVVSDPIHPDLSWLDIACAENEAYMFDMYVAPDFRGKVVTSFLLANALSHLKASGIQRVYGFYERDNLPALWTHRLFGYSERGRRKITRILLYKKSEAAASGS